MNRLTTTKILKKKRIQKSTARNLLTKEYMILIGTILGLEHLQITSPQMKRVRFWDDGESSGYDSCDSDGVPARRPKGASAKLHKKKSTPQNPSQKTSMLRLFQGKFHENYKCLKSLVNYYQTILH